MRIRSGREEGLLYSLSRWTDVPAAKWGWFRYELKNGFMMGVDPRTAVPGLWSLKPEDTLALVFWTKNPAPILRDAEVLSEYRKAIHVTVNGWEEAEKGAPTLEEGTDLLRRTIEVFGQDVIWRFSPVPLVPDVVSRFEAIVNLLGSRAVGLSVYISFIQDNDLITEPRSAPEKVHIIQQLRAIAKRHWMNLRICMADDIALNPLVADLGGVCEDGVRFEATEWEKCGCALSVDPFTINESCVYGCSYCYASDKTLNPKKRNTLKVLR